MKIKCSILYEWEDDIDFVNEDPPRTAEEARECYSECMAEDCYGRLSARADNILPDYRSEFVIEYEDGKRDKWVSG